MGEKLSVEQVLLLNNLIYMENNGSMSDIMEYGDEVAVSTIIDALKNTELEPDKDYGSFMTGEDWKKIVDAIGADEQLMNMQIVTTYKDRDGGGGVSALFADPSTNEAVVVFRGTAAFEWKDNFIGGGATAAQDGVSTECQENALRWYQSLGLDEYGIVTVSGHSKGGNKAKYITIVDDLVDRCLSFDGQGFSDEFMLTYTEQVLKNQDKIRNSNVDYDFVNLLLNDVGDTYWYKGFDYGKGGFLENHCPNTFFEFGSDGAVFISPSVHAQEMAALDNFLNSCLRSVSSEEKKKILNLFGVVSEIALGGGDRGQLLHMFAENDSVDVVSYVLAYLISYERETPQFAEHLKTIMLKFGMDDASGIIDIVIGILNWDLFDGILAGTGFILDHTPGFLINWVREQFGLDLSEEECRNLLSLISKVSETLPEIQLSDDNADIHFGVPAVDGHQSEFSVEPDKLYSIAEKLEGDASEVEKVMERVKELLEECEVTMMIMWLHKIKEVLAAETQHCKLMSQKLREVAALYLSAENRILNE